MVRLWLVPSAAVAALVILGPALAYLEWVDPARGFGLYFVGAFLAALSAGGFGAAAALASALGKPWRRPALRAAVLPLAVVLLAVAPSLNRTRWPYNDVSTDLTDPPAFAVGPPADVPYPEEFAEAQREQFAEIEGSIELPLSVDRAVSLVVTVARAMPGWEGVEVAGPGLVQAVAVSRIFRFRDDLAIRVRSAGRGARIDVRSRSRVGRSDLGANAERIRAFREALIAAR